MSFGSCNLFLWITLTLHLCQSDFYCPDFDITFTISYPILFQNEVSTRDPMVACPPIRRKPTLWITYVCYPPTHMLPCNAQINGHWRCQMDINVVLIGITYVLFLLSIIAWRMQ